MTVTGTAPLPVEAFSVCDVHVAGVDVLGVRSCITVLPDVRDSRRLAEGDEGHSCLEITAGYAVAADLEDGPVEITLPARDFRARPASLIFTIPRVEHWRMLLHVGGYKKETVFTYRGDITNPVGILDVVYADDVTETRHRISTKAYPWPGRWNAQAMSR